MIIMTVEGKRKAIIEAPKENTTMIIEGRTITEVEAPKMLVVALA